VRRRLQFKRDFAATERVVRLLHTTARETGWTKDYTPPSRRRYPDVRRSPLAIIVMIPTVNRLAGGMSWPRVRLAKQRD
jgi:hypothetical protein